MRAQWGKSFSLCDEIPCSFLTNHSIFQGFFSLFFDNTPTDSKLFLKPMRHFFSAYTRVLNKMFVLCCRCFFLPVLYEHSFNLIKQKQKATKVKIPLTVCTYYNVMPVGFSDTKETLELKSNNKRKRRENCILPSFIRYIFTRQSCGYSSRHQRCRKTRELGRTMSSSSLLPLLTTFKYS